MINVQIQPGLRIRITLMRIRIHFNADPDPAFHLVLRNLVHWSAEPPKLHFEPPVLIFIHGHPRLV
jgi:hypothetical protein